MAEEVKAKKGKNWFQRFTGKIADWFRGMRSELKKVVWPTPKQIVNNTGVALVVMIAAGVVIWGFDTVASKAVELLISIFQ